MRIRPPRTPPRPHASTDTGRTIGGWTKIAVHSSTAGRGEPQVRRQFREYNSLAAVVAAPIWCGVWLLTLGRMGVLPWIRIEDAPRELEHVNFSTLRASIMRSEE